MIKRRFSGLFFFILLALTVPLIRGADFAVDVTRVATSGITFTFPAQTDCYYQIRMADSLTTRQWSVRGMSLGSDGTQICTSSAPGKLSAGYYRILRIPRSSPHDQDADGIDDVYELNHRALDPLNPEDAIEDSDADGFLNVYEFVHGSDPQQSNSVPFPALFVSEGGTVNGDGSQGNPFSTIQAAIDVANDYDIIQVEDGLFAGEGNRDISFRGKPIMVLSAHGSQACVIDCQNAGRGICFSQHEDRRTVLRGVTIRNGSAENGAGVQCSTSSPSVFDCVIESNTGVGVYFQSSGADFTRCVVQGNADEGVRFRAGCSNALRYCAILGNAGTGVSCHDNSQPKLLQCLVGDNQGLGVECWETSAAILRDCTIKSNDCGGGASYGSSTSVIENCVVTSNEGDGISSYEGSSLTLTNCRVADNTGSGISCYSEGELLVQCCVIERNERGFTAWTSSPKMDRCIVKENTAGGVRLDGSVSRISNCEIYDNDDNGIACYSSSPNLANNVIVGNHGDGVVFYSSSTSLLNNCTIADNDVAGLSLCLDDDLRPEVHNSILWGNAEGALAAWSGSVTVTHSCVEGGWPGTGNISTNPLLASFFRLTSGSPCIDAGETNGLDTDIDGEARVLIRAGGISSMDMGADEFVDSDCDGMADVWEVESFGNLLQDGLDDGDGDGLTDRAEYENNADPRDADTDDDGLSDDREVQNKTNPRKSDSDDDGLTDPWEVENGTNPLKADSDDDGLLDPWEIENGTNPLDADSDHDLIPDGWEVWHDLYPTWNDAALDPDRDELINLEEYRHGTFPYKWDCDYDKLPDGWEVRYGMNPLHYDDITTEDSDADSLVTLDEYRFVTDPNNPDTDGDGVRDGAEAPASPGSNPNTPFDFGDPANCVTLSLSVGDPSISWSERWRFELLTWAGYPVVQHVTRDFGTPETREYALLKGFRYEGQLVWVDSNWSYDDFDWMALVNGSTASGWTQALYNTGLIRITDDGGLLTTLTHGEHENETIGRKIYIDVLKADLDADVPERVEETEGAFLQVNGGVKRVAIGFGPAEVTNGTLTLRIVSGTGLVSTWSNSDKTISFSLPATWSIGVDTIPPAVYVEATQLSTANRDIRFELVYSCAAGADTDIVAFTAMKTEMAMDGNRDDSIDFDDPDDAKYLFWVNDDVDVISGGEEDDAENGMTNCNDDAITCKRDLEDFTRLHIKVDDNTASTPGITYWLKFESVMSGSPTVNVFEAVNTSTEYLSQPAVAADQIQKRNLTTNGVGTTEVQIDEQYIKSGNEISPFIIEGCSAGKGDLTFIVKKDGNEVCKKAVTLELHDAPWFYDVYTVDVISGDRWEVQVSTTATQSQTASYSPPTDERFLLVHGWNMTDTEKIQCVETVFKRLWWQGYQGSVALFNWPTLAEFGGFWDVVTNPHHFDNSELRSWLSADALIGVFNTLNGSGNKLRVLAHSMGNVVAGEALRRYTGANLHTYLACQAALSAQYYDNTIAANNPCEHQGFPHDLFFPSTPDIMGHFSTGDTNSNPYMTDNDTRVSNMQNFFNAQDWALDLWEINNVRKPDNWAPYLFGYSGSKDHYQEGTDRFTRGSIDNPTEILSVNNQRQRFMIWSYDAESRSRALGQTTNPEFNGWNLHDDPGAGGMGYDGQHYSHSREFRSNIADEWNFWNRVFSTCLFQHP